MGQVYLTGDTHGELGRFTSARWEEGKSLTKRDFLIILGDFGVLWEKDTSFRDYWIKWLDNKPWTTLFLDGNHENFDLINNLQSIDKFGADVGRVSNSVYHLRRGRCYTIQGQTFLTIGGALSIDKQYRTKGTSWWAEEMLSEIDIEKVNETLEEHNYKFDYVLTHTCPTKVKYAMLAGFNYIEDVTDMQLQQVDNSIEYKKWYYGHLHLNRSYFSNYEDVEPTHVGLYETIIKLGDFI